MNPVPTYGGSSPSSTPLLAATTPSYAATSTTTSSTPVVAAAVTTASSNALPPQYELPGNYDPQTQAAFDLMLDMLQSRGFSVSAPGATALSIDQLAQEFLNTANRRAGGVLTEAQIKTVKSTQDVGQTLTRKEVADLFCHQKLSKTNKTHMLYDPTFPPQKTFRAAIDMYTNGRDSSAEGQKRWREGFHPDMLYITTGRLPGISGVTEDKTSTLKDLESKAKKAPHLNFDIFPVLTSGNMAVTFVNNKTPSGPNFVLAGLTFFKADIIEGKEVVRAICNIDTYSSDDAIGAMCKNAWHSFTAGVGRLC